MVLLHTCVVARERQPDVALFLCGDISGCVDVRLFSIAWRKRTAPEVAGAPDLVGNRALRLRDVSM